MGGFRRQEKRRRFRLVDILPTLERVAKALEDNNRVLSMLWTSPDEDYKRFTAWVGVEIDRRNTGKGPVRGMPAVIRAAHNDDLHSWVNGELYRMEAAKRAAIVQLQEGDESRDVSTRWPDLAGYQKWKRPMFEDDE